MHGTCKLKTPPQPIPTSATTTDNGPIDVANGQTSKAPIPDIK